MQTILDAIKAGELETVESIREACKGLSKADATAYLTANRFPTPRSGAKALAECEAVALNRYKMFGMLAPILGR